MQLIAIQNLPEFLPGNSVAEILEKAIREQGLSLQYGDIVAVAQKIISKAEGRYRYLDDVKAEKWAKNLASKCDKDPRLVQLIIDQADEVLRVRKGVIVVQHKLGYVHANAGIDRSNLPQNERERVLLLPEDPDASSQKLRQHLEQAFNVPLGVLINDSAGRAWRNGTMGFAIGTAGFEPLVNLIGHKDRAGRELEVTEVAVADELAAAASFIMGQADESCPVVLIRGAKVKLGDYPSSPLIRDKNMDLFR